MGGVKQFSRCGASERCLRPDGLPCHQLTMVIGGLTIPRLSPNTMPEDRSPNGIELKDMI